MEHLLFYSTFLNANQEKDSNSMGLIWPFFISVSNFSLLYYQIYIIFMNKCVEIVKALSAGYASTQLQSFFYYKLNYKIKNKNQVNSKDRLKSPLSL